jgi:prophage tail gpP-like protein
MPLQSAADLFDDIVEIRLGDESMRIIKSYSIRQSVLNPPSSFQIEVGHGDALAELIKKFPPNTPFQMFVTPQKGGARVPVIAGFTDGYTTSGPPSTLRLQGRDPIGKLFDTYVLSDKNFSEKTFIDLTRQAIEAVGLDPTILIPGSDFEAVNRKAVSGVKVVRVRKVSIETIEETGEIEETFTFKKKTVLQTIKAQLGMRWWDFLKKQYERAGIFLWSGGDGSLIIDAPNPDWEPTYKIVRRRPKQEPQDPSGLVSVTSGSFRNLTVQRYTKAIVNGRAGGGKGGRGKVKGEFVDDEMAELLGGEDIKPIVIKDNEAKSKRQAEFKARRMIAEFNRRAFQVKYTVPGHSTPSAKDGRIRAIWTPNQVVSVDDEEFGIKEDMWISDVEFARAPRTHANLTLMRRKDLVFAREEQFS